MERRLHLTWPLTLIGAGIIWILIEMGRLPVSNLWVIAYLWPLFLIAAGLGLILRPYWRYAGAVLSALTVVGIFLAILFAGQLGWNRFPDYTVNGVSMFAGANERGSGHIVTENRQVHGFTALHIDYPANYTIKQGSTEGLTIEADDNVVAVMRTQVTGGVLEIDSLRDHRVYINPTQPVKVTITVKDLKELSFASAGTVTINGLKTDSLTTLLDGAGTITLNNLNAKELVANLSGVGSLKASGTADTLDARVDGVGGLDAKDLHSNTATVSLSGMGSANVWADSSLTADVSGVGSVNYYGNPQVTKTVSGVGSVHSMGAK